VISLIHSSGSCFPAKSSNRVVVLTEVGRAEMAKHGIMNCVVIPGAIDCNLFGIPEPNYSNHNFGRITRTGTGKIHPQFYSMVERILNQDKTAKCIMYTSNPGKIPMLKHARMIYDKSILINNTQKKAGKLRELSLYIHAHNGYQEVFSMAIAEAMATGLPIIVNEKQDSMKEQLGGTGIFCETIADVEKTILELLPDAQRKKEMGQRARARAKEFTIERMQSAYENLFREVLNDRS
jgi:glycosyltransferase involved in cell wall biosynthesis